ncbi:GtrA family protein [Gorillibacterium sp. sgz5001074]|uniref:GtrA family protein n=1 Tax=Gorillibacterium sp. sgz5001074 TaxID=3446695 RepID=UPI003F66E274
MVTILIPSYEPDQRLLRLVEDLQEVTGMPILIVDDGSGEAYRPIFEAAEAAGCTVLTHRINQGKGAALKTGFRYLRDTGTASSGVVCADSDGQHLPQDILRIARTVSERPGEIILGCRHFTGKVPFRSRFGNSATRWVYAVSTGRRIQDTQTGLRGYSPELLDWLLQVPGDRFEYEMNLLLDAQTEGVTLTEMSIDTVYLNENESSHFRPLTDSARVYLPILKFSASSLLSAGIDFALLFVLQAMTGSLFLAVAGARLISSVFNYSMNRTYVFARGRKRSSVYSSMPRYFALVLVVLLLNYGVMALYNHAIGVPLFASKVLTEATVFAFSFWAQRRFVFRRDGSREEQRRVAPTVRTADVTCAKTGKL